MHKRTMKKDKHWCIVPGLVIKVCNTTQCHKSNLSWRETMSRSWKGHRGIQVKILFEATRNLCMLAKWRYLRRCTRSDITDMKYLVASMWEVCLRNQSRIHFLRICLHNYGSDGYIKKPLLIIPGFHIIVWVRTLKMIKGDNRHL